MQVMSHWAWLNAPPCTKPSTQLLTWMMMDKMIMYSCVYLTCHVVY